MPCLRVDTQRQVRMGRVSNGGLAATAFLTGFRGPAAQFWRGTRRPTHSFRPFVRLLSNATTCDPNTIDEDVWAALFRDVLDVPVASILVNDIPFISHHAQFSGSDISVQNFLRLPV